MDQDLKKGSASDLLRCLLQQAGGWLSQDQIDGPIPCTVQT